jgi:hypothetical protein
MGRLRTRREYSEGKNLISEIREARGDVDRRLEVEQRRPLAQRPLRDCNFKALFFARLSWS